MNLRLTQWPYSEEKPLNHYEQKQQRRKERLEARAEKLAAEGKAKVDSGFERLRAIPFGQPILIGHHSEKRDRNYRAKAGNAIDKGFEMQKAAGELAARAESVGTGGISSDDPDAPSKIEERLAKLEAVQARMVKVNKIIRKHKGTEAKFAALVEAGEPPALATALLTPNCFNGIGFEQYELSNNSANIRRLKARLEHLKRASQAEHKETVVGNTGIKVVENVEANRLQIIYPGKPDAETRKTLKSYGFRWAPSEGAWQRHLSNAARWAAEQITKPKMEG